MHPLSSRGTNIYAFIWCFALILWNREWIKEMEREYVTNHVRFMIDLMIIIYDKRNGSRICEFSMFTCLIIISRDVYDYTNDYFTLNLYTYDWIYLCWQKMLAYLIVPRLGNMSYMIIDIEVMIWFVNYVKILIFMQFL